MNPIEKNWGITNQNTEIVYNLGSLSGTQSDLRKLSR